MKNKLKISVGICAFNEAANIQKILTDILHQQQHNWQLQEILVYADGCTDTTVSQARLLNSDRIQVIVSSKRQGKMAGFSAIIKQFSGSYLFIFDADERLFGDQVINDMLGKFTRDEKTVLVGANTQPYYPKTFFEGIVYTTFLVFKESRRLSSGHNPFACTGGGLAVAGNWVRSLTLPGAILNEDDWLYFSCLSQGLNFTYCESAAVFYRLPRKLLDYLKQSFRSNPQAVTLNLEKKFGAIVAQEYSRPLFFYLKSIWKSLIKYPAATLCAIIINLFLLPFYRLVSKNYQLSWYVAGSTK